jgi:hypothetical protein
LCRLLSADANAEPIPDPNAVGFADADAKPDIDARH